MEEFGEIIGSLIAMVMWIALALLSRKQQKQQEERRRKELESQPAGGLPETMLPETMADTFTPDSTTQRTRAADLPSPQDSASEHVAYAIEQRDDATRTREAAFARLGLDPRTDLSPRELSRRGMLWSEVLGPPRAHRGPHRYAASRFAKRRMN